MKFLTRKRHVWSIVVCYVSEVLGAIALKVIWDAWCTLQLLILANNGNCWGLYLPGNPIHFLLCLIKEDFFENKCLLDIIYLENEKPIHYDWQTQHFECKKEGAYNILMQYYVIDICVNIRYCENGYYQK